MAASGIGLRRDEVTEQVFAAVGYVLLTISVFTAGIPALIAVCFAYVWRDRSSAGMRRHFERQILIFWIAALLLLISMGLGVGAVFAAAGHAAVVSVTDTWTTFSVNMNRLADFDDDKGLSVATPVVVLFVCALVSWALATLWLFLAPIVGMIGLARSSLMGKTGR